MGKAPGIRLLVMRSGATAWDQAGRVQGSCDLPMTAEGRDQVVRRVQTLSSTKFTSILTAPDEASRDTAKLLAKTGAGRVSALPELAEVPLGLWEGLRLDELEERYCRAGRLWLEDPSGVTAPEGQCVAEYAERVMAVLLERLGRCRPGTSVALVVRPIALGVVRCALNEVEMSQMWTMIHERPDDEWYDLTPNDSRLKAPPRRTDAAASAA